MVLLQLTPALETRLDALGPRLPLELRNLVAAHLVRDDDPQLSLPAPVDGEDGEKTATEPPKKAQTRTILHTVLVKVSQWAKGRDDLDNAADYRLSSLLRLTDVHAPPLPPREKSPELLAILAQIQLDADRVSYAQLTSLGPAPHPSLFSHPHADAHDPARWGGKPKTAAEEWKEIRREVGAIVNVAASMAAVATAVWWVGGGRSYAARLSLAMLGAVAIAAIEGFLYYRFFTRHERAQPGAGKKKVRAATRGGPAAGPAGRKAVKAE
ncbi:hypothetical protein JCM10207_008807 [Rhodosporidiobolus poonsookiae]